MLTTKQEKLLTSGQLAKLAQSTKRTVHWYTEHGLLRPKSTNVKGYRFYSIEQIIDLQVIMLLRKLHFSLPEVKRFLRKNASTKELFLQKKSVLEQDVANLQENIQEISSFYKNLETEGVLIKPVVKTVPSFKAFYIEKVGPYSKILDYCSELKSYFSKLPKDTTYFVLFPDREYAPKKDRLKIGVVAKQEMKLKVEFKTTVKMDKIPSYKALTYKHEGSPALISMLIMQMHAYMDKKKIKQNLTLPINELEFYINSSLNTDIGINDWLSEITIPIL